MHQLVRNHLLLKAAMTGDTQACQDILAQGADVNMRSAIGRTPLHEAASKGYVDFCRLLVAHGADITIANDDGYKAIQVAVESNKLPVVQFFLSECSEDIDQVTSEGRSLDYIAGFSGHEEMAAFLATYRLSLKTEHSICDALPDESIDAGTSRSRTFSPL